MLLLTLLTLLPSLALTQNCISQDGQPVLWWIVLKTPPKTGTNAFGYFDSSMQTTEFKYYDFPLDKNPSALTKTIENFNLQNYNHVAWND